MINRKKTQSNFEAWVLFRLSTLYVAVENNSPIVWRNEYDVHLLIGDTIISALIVMHSLWCNSTQSQFGFLEIQVRHFEPAFSLSELKVQATDLCRHNTKHLCLPGKRKLDINYIVVIFVLNDCAPGYTYCTYNTTSVSCYYIPERLGMVWPKVKMMRIHYIMWNYNFELYVDESRAFICIIFRYIRLIFSIFPFGLGCCLGLALLNVSARSKVISRRCSCWWGDG